MSLSIINSNYSYVIMPGHPIGDKEYNSKYDEVYSLWKSVWHKVFSQLEKKKEANADDFFRQNLVVAIYQGPNLVAMHLYSFYNLDSLVGAEQSYFATLPPEIHNFFIEHGMRTIMTMEYLTVAPAYRKTQSHISWGDVLVVLGTRLLEYTDCDWAIGTARKDINIHQMGHRCNFTTSEYVVSRCDYPCELMYRRKGPPPVHPDEHTRKLVDQLWNNRQDFSQLTIQPNTIKKVA